MPKLIIIIEEKMIEHPDDPTQKMLGLGTSSNVEIEENELPTETILIKLAPLLVEAISQAIAKEIGPPAHAFQGDVGDSIESAFKKAIADEFPDSIEVVSELIN